MNTIGNFFREIFNPQLDEALPFAANDNDTLKLINAIDSETSRPVTIGDVLNATGLKVAHFRSTPDSFGLGLSSARDTTVVYRPRQDPRHTIEVATAVVSENDVFDRKLGAFIALERFIDGRTAVLPPNFRDQTDYDLLAGIFA